MGPPLRGILDKSLKPVQMKELDDEWGKMSGGPAVPNRRLRSQQVGQSGSHQQNMRTVVFLALYCVPHILKSP